MKQQASQTPLSAYAVGQQWYLDFCQRTALTPCPASEHQLMLFAGFLASQGLRWQTIKSYLEAVRNLHIRAGLPFPGQDESLPRLQLLLRGIRQVASWHPPTRPRLPIIPSILRRVGAHWKVRRPLGTDKWYGQLSSLRWDLLPFHVQVWPYMLPVSSRPYGGQPHPSYQTDPFRLGVTLVLGATQRDLCPIAAILPYVALGGDHGSPVSVGQQSFPKTRKVCDGDQTPAPTGRTGSRAVFKSQLPDWGSHGGGSGRPGGPYHPNPGSTAKHSIPHVHQTTAGFISPSVNCIGLVEYLKESVPPHPPSHFVHPITHVVVFISYFSSLGKSEYWSSDSCNISWHPNWPNGQWAIGLAHMLSICTRGENAWLAWGWGWWGLCSLGPWCPPLSGAHYCEHPSLIKEWQLLTR